MKFPVTYCIIHRAAIFWVLTTILALIQPHILTCDVETNVSLSQLITVKVNWIMAKMIMKN